MQRNATTALLALLLCLPVLAQPTVNGSLIDPDYVPVAAKANSNAGFGSNIDVSAIKIYPDDTNGILYIGVEGKLDTGNSNGIGLWLGFSEQTGIGAGSALGFDGAGHYISGQGGGTNDDFAADFEVDYMFAINPGGGTANVFLDAASVVGGTTASFLGQTNQTGTSAQNTNTEIFSASSVTFAFNNGGGSDQGLELSIPYSELGVTSAGTVTILAFVVSDTGFFSDVTVPGDVVVGNPGFNTDFTAIDAVKRPGPYNTGPLSLSSSVLPVELVEFTATAGSDAVELNWATATETDNAGFFVEQLIDVASGEWMELGFVSGAGTTTETQRYSYTVSGLAPGTHRFRLRQVDFDGTTAYSGIVEASVDVPGGYVLERAYPNPFNPEATVRFAVATEQPVSLTLYDLLGRPVRTLYSGVPAANEMLTARIDGSALVSGTYLVRLTGESFSTTQTVTLLK
ncbi:MAG: T9SS type A sorting domain-containing protein [Bacteroidota bacterium]